MNIFRRFFGAKTSPSEIPGPKPQDPIANDIEGSIADTFKKSAIAGQQTTKSDDSDITLEIDGEEIIIQRSTFDLAVKMYAPALADAKSLVKKAASLKIGNPDRAPVLPEIEALTQKLQTAAEDTDAARALVSVDELAIHYKLGGLEMKLEMAIIDLETELESMQEDDVDYALETSELVMPDGALRQYRIEYTYSIRKSKFIDVFLIGRDPYGPDHPSLYCWSFAEHERIDIPVKRIGEIVEIESGNLVKIDELPI